MTGDTPHPDNLTWDPFDEALKADPHRVWRRRRDEAPVNSNEKFDFWVGGYKELPIRVER